MDAYCDLRVLPDPEFPSSMLLDAAFAKLHRALVASRETAVGVSFPDRNEAKSTLGTVLRLHGDRTQLHHLVSGPWLHGMRDHLHVRAVAAVPAGAGSVRVQRVQPRPSSERLIRRQLRRHGGDERTLREAYAKVRRQHLTMPSLTLRSASTGQTFRLFIEHKECGDRVSDGGFNHYGLSLGSTVPMF